MDDYEKLPIGKQVWSTITQDEFYRMIQRAKIEGCFLREDGKVDINRLIRALCKTYGDGTYTILHNAPTKNADKKSTGVEYVASRNGECIDGEPAVPPTELKLNDKTVEVPIDPPTPPEELDTSPNQSPLPQPKKKKGKA